VTTETDEPPAETLGVVALGVVALGVVTLGVVTIGVVRDGVVALGVVTWGVVTVGVVTVGVVTLGVVTVVTGGSGTVTLGTVVGTVVEIVGSGGRGSAATACPARNPTPKSNTRNAATLMPLQLRTTEFGCGLRPSATFHLGVCGETGLLRGSGRPARRRSGHDHGCFPRSR
jgi:GLTT repeat (6 copies)